MLLPLVLLLVVAATLGATSIGQAKAWPEYGYGWHGWQSQWYQPVGCGGCYHQFGFGPWQVGYNAGYTDFSTNNGYDCGYTNNDHSVTYCNGYQSGWNDAQNQNQDNQQTDTSTTTTNQDQGQDQSSTAYSQSTSNPNVHVTVNNIVPGAGAGNTDEGPVYTSK